MAKVVMPPNMSDGPKNDIQPKPQESVRTVQVVQRKRTISERIASFLFNEEIDNVSDYVINDILIPALKDTLTSMISNGADMLFHGSRGGGRSQFSNPYSDRGGATFVQPDTRYSYRNTSSVPRRGYKRLNDYYFRSEAEARYVIDQLELLTDQYGWASVDDYYQLIGVSGTHVDQKWGWMTMGNARIRRDRDGWVIDFEEARPRQ